MSRNKKKGIFTQYRMKGFTFSKKINKTGGKNIEN